MRFPPTLWHDLRWSNKTAWTYSVAQQRPCSDQFLALDWKGSKPARRISLVAVFHACSFLYLSQRQLPNHLKPQHREHAASSDTAMEGWPGRWQCLREHPGFTEILSIINPGLEDGSWPPTEPHSKVNWEMSLPALTHRLDTGTPRTDSSICPTLSNKDRKRMKRSNPRREVPRLSANGFSQQEVVL